MIGHMESSVSLPQVPTETHSTTDALFSHIPNN
jgi:hypothetical protein